MLAQENDQLLASRLGQLEEGVRVLDTRVAGLDEKVSHVMQQNSEMLIRQGEEFRGLRSALDEQRAELKKSIRQLSGRYSTKCQLLMFGTGLSAWTIFMAWVMWA